MTNKEIASVLKLTSELMELHEENPFKIKSLASASFRVSKVPTPLFELDQTQLEKIEGIGKGIATKIVEMRETGQLSDLNNLLAKTPNGIVSVMQVKGLGPKKVKELWHGLGIESIGELYYACKENRLITLKGFGEKTQTAVLHAIEFMQENASKFRFANAELVAVQVLEKLKIKYPETMHSLVGPMRRKCEIVEQIDVVVAGKINTEELVLEVENPKNIPINIVVTTRESFVKEVFLKTGTEEHLRKVGDIGSVNYSSEEEIYSSKKMQFIEPELREGLSEVDLALNHKLPELISVNDLKGCLHNHSTYSDGINTVKEMAEHCILNGLQYFGICDHSQTAVYAGGLTPEKVLQQQKEIDGLNTHLAPFKIFKGIESDILGDGSLDYDEEILKTFDFVVASVHSNLKMDEEKAMKRLLKAIENPYTTMLGHPTGRLLLAREGYPLNHKKIIDACAANKVIIELNANPYRLDIDWRWISYCMEKGVMISINPDAHQKETLTDMYYGVCVARKGMLTKEHCFNALSLQEIEEYFKSRKS